MASIHSNRKVSFGTIQVRSYDRIAGDNPAVSDGGPSLGLSWDFVVAPQQCLNQYETQRENERASGPLYPLSQDTRRFLLAFVFDIPSKDIQRSAKLAQKIQAQRQETLQQLKMERAKDLTIVLSSNAKMNAQTKKNKSYLVSGIVEDPLPRSSTRTKVDARRGLLGAFNKRMLRHRL